MARTLNLALLLGHPYMVLLSKQHGLVLVNLCILDF